MTRQTLMLLSVVAVTGCGGTLLDHQEQGLLTQQNLKTEAFSNFQSAMPTPRSSLAAAVDEKGLVYAIGGNISAYGCGDSGAVASVESFDPYTGKWEIRHGMRSARCGPGAVTGADGQIYVAGGWDGASELATAERFDPGTNAWTALPSMSIPRDSVAAAVGSDGRIYVLGGFDHGAVASAEVFTPSTGQWARLPDMPTARYGLGAAFGSDGLLYVIGGMTGDGSLSQQRSSNVVEVFNPTSSQWTAGVSLPVYAYGPAVAADASGKVFVMGGQDFRQGTDPADMIQATVEVLDPSVGSWSTVSPLPAAAFLAAGTSDSVGRVYSVGGFNVNELHALDVYQAANQSWISVDHN